MKNHTSTTFPKHIVEYVANHDLIGLKAGIDREKFLYIWMVTFENRIFCRSWSLKDRSWFTVFEKDPAGSINCGGEVISVVADILGDSNHTLTEAINAAYLNKYNKGDNISYARQMVEKERWHRTVELKPM